VSQAQLYVQIAVWSQVVSSIVFIAVLVYMWFRFLLPVFLAAQERSNAQIAEAERHRDEVKAALQALNEEIEIARRDATGSTPSTNVRRCCATRRTPASARSPMPAKSCSAPALRREYACAKRSSAERSQLHERMRSAARAPNSTPHWLPAS
jgi:hypothetical protein